MSDPAAAQGDAAAKLAAAVEALEAPGLSLEDAAALASGSAELAANAAAALEAAARLAARDDLAQTSLL